MDYTWYDFIGNVGVFVLLAAYLALILNKISSEDLIYSVANGVGAIFILISLVYEFNLSAFTIESAWLVISLVGIVNYYRSIRKPALAEVEV